jgi:hypothetical protein
MGQEIKLAVGCNEPGYDDKPVVIANWNKTNIRGSSGFNYSDFDYTMPRLSKLFEKLGYSVEWIDEWTICDDCGKAIRTSPDSWGWKPNYFILGDCGEIICYDCFRKGANQNPE